MNSIRGFFGFIVLVSVFSSIQLFAQPMPQYQLTIQNPVLSGTTYQFDIYVKRIGAIPFRIGNSQFIMSFNNGQFTSPAISRIASSEQTGSGFFFDQVISGSELRISLGGNGSYVNATDIATSGSGTRISTYQVTGVNVPVLSPALSWLNFPVLIRTGVSEINSSDNYREITDLTGASHVNGGGEFGRISGYKFNDLNGDATWEQPTEPALNGWTINLMGVTGPFTAITGSGTWPTGYYEFNNLTPGDYTITEVVQSGWSPTFSPVNPLHVVSGQLSQNVNFGNYNGPAIVGMKFNDLNGNGVRDAGEPGIAGWQIVANKVGGGGSKTALTNVSGNYALTFLSTETGMWQIGETIPPGWIQTYPVSPSTYTINILSGTYVAGRDFGNYLASSIAGMKFNDVNGDSTQNAGEPGIAGWRIRLIKNGTQVDSMLTDATGHYIFDSLAAGSYAVVESSASGWIQTLPASPAGYPVNITVGGTTVTGRDFGNYQLSSISGIVYHDLNHNGAPDGGEPGMAGVQINAISTARSYHVVTAVGGSWTIPNVLAGTYTISEQIPSGYHLTQPTGGTYPAPVVSGTVIAGLQFGNSAVADSTQFRTCSYESMALAQYKKGKIGPVKRKPDKVHFSVRIINLTQRTSDALHINFRVPLYVNNPAYPIIVTPTPDGITTQFSSKQVFLTWSDSIRPGDTVTLSGWGTSPKYQGATSYLWRSQNPSQPVGPRAQFTLNTLGYPMPNAANMYDELFLDNAFGPPGTGGLIVGVPKPDEMRYYGWVRISTEKNLQKSFYDRSGLHTNNARGFGDLTHRPFLKEHKVLPPLVQNNLLFADVAALKINIAASEIGITAHGLGELIYDDGQSPLSGLSARQLALQADSLLTYWRFVPSSRFVGMDTVIAKINTAFEGPIDSISFVPALVYTGARTLQSVAYLRANPGVAPAVVESKGPRPADRPEEFSLYQNYPNPFNPTTTISFSLAQSGLVTLRVFNILGQQIATLLDRQLLDEGEQDVEFHAENLPSGVYLYRLEVVNLNDDGAAQSSGFLSQARKMMLIK